MFSLQWKIHSQHLSTATVCCFVQFLFKLPVKRGMVQLCCCVQIGIIESNALR